MYVAPTEAAASLIGGSIYHSALGFSQFEGENTENVNTAFKNLQYTEYIFLDVISMVDAGDFYKISERMCIAMEKPEEAFRGINIIAAGDFTQLLHVNINRALYVGTVQFQDHTTHSVLKQKASIGMSL